MGLFLASGGPFLFLLFLSYTIEPCKLWSIGASDPLLPEFNDSDEFIVSEMRFEDIVMLPKAREDFCMC